MHAGRLGTALAPAGGGRDSGSTLLGDGQVDAPTQAHRPHRLAPPSASQLVPYGNPGKARLGMRCHWRCRRCCSHFLTLWIGRVRGLPAPRDTLASPTGLCRWETPWAALQFGKGKCQMQPSRLACQDLPLRCWQSCLLKK